MKNSEYINESVKEYFKSPPSDLNSSALKKLQAGTQIKKILGIFLLLTILILVMSETSKNYASLQSPQQINIPCIWEICSIDTMKTSRDRARAELNNPGYDLQIQSQLKLIKDTGASYVAIDTPYDAEFLPYLKRWVKLSREAGLKVWFRGNWSNWEGWFDYPKNMTPDEHLKKTVEFIISSPEMFEFGDIFDPCPECENAGFWPQNDKNKDYQQYVQTQQKQTAAAFDKINKHVVVRQSIIGGRAKDVLDKDTFDTLGNIIPIDHYVKTPKVMEDFINYFWENYHTKSLVSEFGAPIPDINGPMDETQQVEFVEAILETLYKNRSNIHGLNYWVLSEGITQLINEDNTPRPVYAVLKKYFSPGQIYGTVVNNLGETLGNIEIKTTDNEVLAKTNENGYYSFPLPPRKIELAVEAENFDKETSSLEIKSSNEQIEKNFTLKPTSPGILHQLKLWIKNTF